MPLRKLWNSIRGTKNPSENECSESGGLDRPAARVNPSTDLDTSSPIDLGQPATAGRPVVQKVEVSSVSEGRQKLSREDKRLCSRLESLPFSTILEISVLDASRSVSILRALTQEEADTNLRYLAIDEFELGGNLTTMRGFHQQLREVRVKAQLLPMKVEAGLERLLRTIGQVDVILWSSESTPSENVSRLLGRLSGPDTLIFSNSGKCWEESRCGLFVETNRKAA